MDATIKKLLVGRIGITILGDITIFLEDVGVPKEDWSELMIEAVIFIFERGEAILDIPYLEQLRDAIDKYLKERKDAQQVPEGNV